MERKKTKRFKPVEFDRFRGEYWKWITNNYLALFVGGKNFARCQTALSLSFGAVIVRRVGLEYLAPQIKVLLEIGILGAEINLTKNLITTNQNTHAHIAGARMGMHQTSQKIKG
jgi:hypothetical protein